MTPSTSSFSDLLYSSWLIPRSVLKHGEDTCQSKTPEVPTGKFSCQYLHFQLQFLHSICHLADKQLLLEKDGNVLNISACSGI